MKTQISRDGYRRDKRYSGVYQQQGRLITDSDWNELVDTLKERMDEALVDVIGSGSPKGRAVQVSMGSNAPRLSPGYVYGSGLAGFVEPIPNINWPFGFNQQKGFPSAPPLPPASSSGVIAYKIYADVWERPVTALEDEVLRDPALHGADTCTRTQVMAQVKTYTGNLGDLPSVGSGLLTVRFPSSGGQTVADACDPKAQEVDPVGGDFLLRLEVHDANFIAGDDPTRVVVKWSRENGAEQYAFEDVPDWYKTGPWIYELFTVESEHHLGLHSPALASSQSWTPKRGSLVTALPQTAPEAGTLVRRWDGYCVFVRSGQTWAVSTAAGETLNVTAPGTTVTFQTVTHGEISRIAAKLALADLELLLEIEGAAFVPGDYWTVPVRREIYEAGKELVKEAYPTGIIHRYVPLAELLNNNTLKPLTVDEQHRRAFPRLTDLDAEDIKYGTTCTSGLFTSAHDTVEKALDRLCAINGSHVGYTKPFDTSVYRGETPTTVKAALDLLARVTSDDIAYTTTCTSGLFNNTHDTVEKALNRLCAINATHVGFTKPADTSVFQGVNPTTVGQALDLLQDVKSQQISYIPDSNPNVHDVKAALDELYARPVQNGTRVYIGENGQYASIDLAVADLVSMGAKDIALALLPGEHTLPANWNPGNLTDFHMSILGLGGSTRILLSPGAISFNSLASFRLDQVTVIFENASLAFNNCRDVFLTDNSLEGSRVVDKAMLYFVGNQNVVVRGNVIDTQWESADIFFAQVLSLGSFENIPDLFTVSLSEFRTRAHNLSQTLLNLPPTNRTAVGNGIVNRATSASGLTSEEREAYQALGNAIAGVNPVETVRAWFEHIRHLAYIRNPGTSIVLNAFAGPTSIHYNQISGLIGLLSLPKNGTSLNGVSLSGFYNNFQSGRLSLPQARHVLQIHGNVMAGIRGGESLITDLRNVANTGVSLTYSRMFKVLDMVNNVVENEDNLFLAEEINLHGNNFTSLFTPAPPQGLVGWLIGSSATVNDNRARMPVVAGSLLHSGILAHSSNTMFNSNFRFVIGFIIIG